MDNKNESFEIFTLRSNDSDNTEKTRAQIAGMLARKEKEKIKDNGKPDSDD